MKTKNKAYGILILIMFLMGCLGGAIALLFHGVNISPFIFLILPVCIGFGLKSMIKYFKEGFRL